MPDIGLRNQVKILPISFALTGDNTIIAAVAGKLINVVAMLLVSTGATNITIKDGAANLLSGAMPLAAGVPLILHPDASMDYFATSSGTNAFILNQSGAVQISGTVWFLQY
jgi:hypothetical protein